MTRAYANVRIEGEEKDVNTILSALAHLDRFCVIGTSRSIAIRMDGDGVNMSFLRVDDKGEIQERLGLEWGDQLKEMVDDRDEQDVYRFDVGD